MEVSSQLHAAGVLSLMEKAVLSIMDRRVGRFGCGGEEKSSAHNGY